MPYMKISISILICFSSARRYSFAGRLIPNGASHRCTAMPLTRPDTPDFGWLSNPIRRHVCCRPRLIWRAAAVIAVWAHMAVSGISEFLRGLVQFLLRPKFIEVGAFIFQSIEISLHRRIVVWVSGFAHALCHMDRFTVLYESL